MPAQQAGPLSASFSAAAVGGCSEHNAGARPRGRGTPRGAGAGQARPPADLPRSSRDHPPRVLETGARPCEGTAAPGRLGLALGRALWARRPGGSRQSLPPVLPKHSSFCVSW